MAKLPDFTETAFTAYPEKQMWVVVALKKGAAPSWQTMAVVGPFVGAEAADAYAAEQQAAHPEYDWLAFAPET